MTPLRHTGLENVHPGDQLEFYHYEDRSIKYCEKVIFRSFGNRVGRATPTIKYRRTSGTSGLLRETYRHAGDCGVIPYAGDNGPVWNKSNCTVNLTHLARLGMSEAITRCLTTGVNDLDVETIAEALAPVIRTRRV
jgi:hypothetical protein